MEGVSIEETEEGEVDDGSEPEDADSGMKFRFGLSYEL